MKDIDALQSRTGDKKQLLNILMQLRKVCNHPYLFQGAEPGPPYVEGDHLIQNSGKMVLLDKLLKKMMSQGSRVLLFCQMTRMLDILEDYCLYRGYKYCRLDGDSSSDEREEAMEVFNAEGSEKFIFLLSTRAGGLGINLYTADTVILYDSDWNPQMDLQAQDRAHRIGQKKQVYVYRFVSSGTIEEKIVERAMQKLFLDALVIQQGTVKQKKQSQMSADNMLSMIRFGAEEIFRTEGSSITDDDIDSILEASKKRTEERNKQLESQALEVKDKLSNFSLDGNYGSASMYDFQGEDFQNLKKYQNSFDFIPVAKRERDRPASYDVNAYYRSQLYPSSKPYKPRTKVKFRPTTCLDHQFYSDPVRLNELEELEYLRKEELEESLTNAESAEGKKTELELPDPLSASERDELNRLRGSGFSSWSKRDFLSFLHASELFGRNDLNSISQNIPGKTEAEVRAYSKVFWDSYKKIDGWQKYIKMIEKGEEKLVRSKQIEQVIKKKLNKYKNKDALYEMNFSYGKNDVGNYTIEEDRFLFVKMSELGYGSWEEIKLAVRKSPLFYFGMC